MKDENDRHQQLLNNASRRQALQKQQNSDDKKMEELLRIIPEACRQYYSFLVALAAQNRAWTQ
jgi:Tfp pilus assembly protein PilN